MKTLPKLMITALFLALQFSAAISLNLTITNPRVSFTKYPGTIEEMKMTVKPQGAYLEVGLFLTFSPRGSVFSSVTDTLEAVLDFELDPKAFINDLWLFVNDTVYIKAKLMDKWTAGFIYEGIVQRRLDPSILYKKDQNKYQVKVFPLLGNSTRTVRINFYVPCTWSDYTISAKLPFDFFNVSNKKPEKIKIYAFPDTLFTNPEIVNLDTLKFIPVNNPRFGETLLAEMPFNLSAAYNTIRFSQFFPEGIFANSGTQESENFYQVVIDPRKFIDFIEPVRIAFLLDYDKSKSDITRNDVIKTLKETIYKKLTPLDSFNIFFSNDNILRLSGRWIPADTAHIEHYFGNITEDKIRTTTNLANLLYTGVDWVNKNADKAIVLVIANTDQHGKQDTANSVGKIVLDLITNHISISVCSYVLKNWTTNFIAGVAYTGNDYLYASLVKISRGILNKINDNGLKLSTQLENTLNSIVGGYENISTSSYVVDGFTYDKIGFSDKLGSLTLSEYYTEFGKFMGEKPLNIEVTGLFRKTPFHKTFRIDSDSLVTKYNNRTLWAGNFLRNMETNKSLGTILIYDIINKSLDYNVLSIYTAFLATDDDKKDTLQQDKDDIIPVELMYFDGKARNGAIDLSWATASEINNYGFYIDKKNLSINEKWQNIGFVAGFGDSKTIRYYNYSDKDVIPNNTYQYVLRQVDLDGTSNCGSQIITVHYDAEFNLTLEQNYPNPMGDETKIRFTLQDGSYINLDILDINGNEVAQLISKELTSGEYELIWNGKDSGDTKLANGTYLCRLRLGNKTRIIKIIINR
jgi:hypothetical protein